ncbi:MAG TPA: DUF6765 family protein [Ruminiclostridium sp.]|nr:DUF6765 family protein [Ruminiclostridium sp.]
MDINFHYFAVKTLARKAGFNENDAQVIAQYSQFVDDYNQYENLWLSDVPVFARSLARKLPIGWFFYTVTTGFDSWDDMARLVIPKYQREITIPYHFIPTQPLNVQRKTRDEWRTNPARMDTPSLMQSLMLEAQNIYKTNPLKENLIRIGLLLHTFADTYAHQNFSGFHGWENYCWLTRAVNNIDGSDITASFSPGKYHKIYAIGHTEATHAPDLSYLTMDLKLKLSEGDNYTFSYTRSNTQEFTFASQEILNFLCDCLGTPHPSQDDWNTFSTRLAQGFLTTSEKVPELCSHWSNVFPEYQYYYDKKPLFGETTNQLLVSYNVGETANQVMGTRSDDFFHYNVIAMDIRNKVSGKTPLTQVNNMMLSNDAVSMDDLVQVDDAVFQNEAQRFESILLASQKS